MTSSETKVQTYGKRFDRLWALVSEEVYYIQEIFRIITILRKIQILCICVALSYGQFLDEFTDLYSEPNIIYPAVFQ